MFIVAGATAKPTSPPSSILSTRLPRSRRPRYLRLTAGYSRILVCSPSDLALLALSCCRRENVDCAVPARRCVLITKHTDRAEIWHRRTAHHKFTLSHVNGTEWDPKNSDSKLVKFAGGFSHVLCFMYCFNVVLHLSYSVL